MDEKDRQSDTSSSDNAENDLEASSCVTCYSTFVYRYPWLVIGLSLALVVAMILTIVFTYGFHVGAEIDNYRWAGTDVTDAWDAYAGASKVTYSTLNKKIMNTQTIPPQSSQSTVGVVVYQIKGGNILTVDSLKEIWKAEEDAQKTADFDKFCFKVSGVCQPFQSIITALKSIGATYDTLSPIHIMTVLMSPVVTGSFVGRDYNQTTHSSEALRTIIPFGLPLEGYKNRADRYSEQMDKYNKWGKTFVKPFNSLYDRHPNNLRAYDIIPIVVDDEVSQVIAKQVLWLIGSFGLCFVMAYIHIRSFYLSIVGVLGVVFSIPVSMGVCFGIIGIEHFDALNVLGLFLICGIGTDSIFIFFDMVRQKQFLWNKPGCTPEKRFAHAVQKGLTATFISLMTTAICFLSLLYSGAKVLKYFGIFCFLELVFDFVFASTLYVATLAIWLKRDDKRRAEAEAKKEVKDEEEELPKLEKEDYPDNSIFAFLKKKPQSVNADGLHIHKYNFYERLWHNKVSPVVYHYRLIIIIVFLAFAAGMAYKASGISAKAVMTFFYDDQPLQHGLSLIQNGFLSTSLDFSFVMVWGIQSSLNPSVRQVLTIDSFGDTKFNKFDLKPVENQQFLLDACDYIEGLTDIVNQQVTDKITCPIRLWRDHAMASVSEFPVTEANFDTVFTTFSQYLSDHLAPTLPETTAGSSPRDTIGFSYVNDSIMYMAVRAEMKIPDTMDTEKLQPLYDAVKAAENHLNSIAPPTMTKGYSTSKTWLTLDTQKRIINETLLNIIVSVCFAILVVFLLTLSFSYTLFFALCLICVIVTIVGLLGLMGWSIGMHESVMLTISAGFCTDFFIHTMSTMAFAHKYTRFGKVQLALTTYCSPVTMSLLTTIGAAVFLLPSVIPMFSSFGIFLIMSAAFGFMYGFLVLPSIAGSIGPKVGDNLTLLCSKRVGSGDEDSDKIVIEP